MGKFNDNDSSYFHYPGGENKTSTAFLVQLQDHDSKAWQDFMELYVPLIQKWCRDKGFLTRPERQDILLEVLRKVVDSMDQFNHNRQERSFRGWLRRITENQIVDHIREKAKNQEITSLYSDPNSLHELIPTPPSFEIDDKNTGPEQEASEQLILLKQVLNRIQPEFREKSWDVFHLLFVAEKDSAEVAETMHMTSEAVRQIRSRILKRIREEYAKWGIETDLPNTISPADR